MTDPNLPDSPPPPPPGVAGPSYNSQVPQYPAPQQFPGQYPTKQFGGQPGQPPQYRFPYQPKQPLGSGARVGIALGAGCLVLVALPIIFFVILAIIGVASATSYESYEPSTTSSDDPDSSTGSFDDPASDPSSPESVWKSGEDWLAAPVAIESPPGEFLPGFATPEDWLASTGSLPDGFDIVYTSDPAYNCGLEKVTAGATWVVGCYNPDYGRTLFLWWGAEASDDMKKLILLHEYSHFFQNWTNFDSMYSASLAGLFDDPEFVQDVWETDATCRVYDDWDFTNLQYLDDSTVSPCGSTDWSTDWFEEQLEERGVTVKDW